MEQFGYLDELFGEIFDNAPRQVEAKISLVINAINRGDLGEALNKLRQAQAIVDKENLVGWQAELLAVWAYYYYAGGPEPRPGTLRHCIEEAHRLEPDNKRLWQVIELLKARYRKQR